MITETLIQIVALAATAVFIVGRLSAKIDAIDARVARLETTNGK